MEHKPVREEHLKGDGDAHGDGHGQAGFPLRHAAPRRLYATRRRTGGGHLWARQPL